eukprot:14218129-Alexandrium_andersonii.AAC.1
MRTYLMCSRTRAQCAVSPLYKGATPEQRSEGSPRGPRSKFRSGSGVWPHEAGETHTGRAL